jgi:hypothetical protein
MSVDMTDFELSLGGPRKGQTAGAADGHLDAMAAEIRALDEAAELASMRVGQSAAELRSRRRGGASGDEDLLGELAGAVAERTQGIREECGELNALLDRARRLVADAPPAEPDWEVTAAALEGAPEPWAQTQPGERETRSPSQRLAATQMAISGSTRAEIQAHLGAELEPAEIESLLDEVFGERRAGASR